MAKRQTAPRPAASGMDAIVSLAREVQNATLVDAAPPGDYVYELKYDGYRILACKSGRQVRLISRREQDWTTDFAEVAAAVADLPEAELVLDGEVVAPDSRGVPSFQRLQNRSAPFSYVLFDLLRAGGEDVRRAPLEARRARLERLLSSAPPGLVLSTSIAGDPKLLLEAACANGFEGIIGKRAGSPYRPGRSLDWIKLKCRHRQEFAIIGYVPLTGTRGAVGSLLLALRRGADYVFAGKVGTGFDRRTRSQLAEQLEAHRVASAPARDVPRLAGSPHFSEPRLVAEVKFSEWTEGGHARHPSFVGLRPDKRPEDCVREQPVPPPSPSPSSDDAPVVAGIRLSHARRKLAPLELSKLELARYYESIADWIVPHVRGRPLTLLRWAEGRPSEKGGVYMRHQRAWGPAALRRVRIREQKKTGEYLVADDLAGVIGLVQMDILELHTWNSTTDHLEHPDRLVFDLDPGPGVTWAALVESAHDFRAALRGIQLESWVKTSGGKGLHIVLPILPLHDWHTCFEFTRVIAAHIAKVDAERFTTSLPKRHRSHKILIDYLRNNRGNTSVAAYSTRANPSATVSTPIAWEELDAGLASEQFTVGSVPQRLSRLARDPWAEYWTTEQRLPLSPGPARSRPKKRG
jgi:bifunctional non-homologous end joining protein LigD